MKKLGLIIVLLTLHVPMIEVYANSNKDTINSNICTTAMSEGREKLSVYFEAIEQEDLKTLLTFNDINWDASTRYKAGHTLLSLAAKEGKVKSINMLVSQIGIDANSRGKSGWTPLHYAVLNLDMLSRTNAIYTLVRLGANVDALDKIGNKPSSYARSEKHAIVSLEQEHQAIYLALVTKDILEVAELLQISSHILSRLVQDFKTNNNNLTVQ